MNSEPTPLLLLGCARSGTTLFQRILNSYDGVIIWGEHAGFLAPVAESYFRLLDSESMRKFSYSQAKGDEVSLDLYKSPDQWQAWNNWFEKHDVSKIYNDFLRKFFVSSWEGHVTHWGFKEIRYGTGDRVVDFLVNLNERTKVVVIYRNPLNVIESQLSAFGGVSGRLEKIRKIIQLPKIIRMAKSWRRMNRRFMEYYRNYPRSVVIFSYENFISGNGIPEKVLKNLELEFGDAQREVMKMKAGRGSAFTTKGNSTVSNRWRRLGFLPAFFVFVITFRTYGAIKKIGL